MSVMTFGATCSPCSAQFVKNKNAEEFQAAFPNAVKAIIDNHYVDDFEHCFSTPEEAVQTTNEVRWIHKQGGFDLKRFVSNAKSVTEQLNGNAATAADFSLDKEGFQKVLGMYWDTAEDILKFALILSKVDKAVVNGERRPTKREALGIAMSVFDPFGLAPEFTLAAKLVLQAVWRRKTEWDESIPKDAYEMWLKWVKMLEQIQNLSIPRCYDENFLRVPVEHNVFADASDAAYAAVAYWRIDGLAGATKLAFVMGKAKCAPLKLTTVPRLELQSAVLAVRLRAAILQNHDMVPIKTVMWSDSKTTLAWIKSDHRRYKPYVAHRVNEILENSEECEWRWLPSACNPADFGTRVRDEKRQSFWASGPDFLLKDETHWPTAETYAEAREELRAKFVSYTCVENDFFERFSCFIRLTRVVAWMLRFCDNCQNSQRDKRGGPLTVYELEIAELSICRGVQKAAYPEEYNDLSRKSQLKSSSKLLMLSPYMDDAGIIRMKGRIDNADAVPINTRRPIILPQAHHVTDLVVSYYHRKLKHQNEGTTIAEIRRKFWIPHARVSVRRAARECQFCKIKRAQPETPSMGPLPKDRLTPFVRPFSYEGLDYMGPFLVSIGRRQEKRWIALFTCLTIRAVHMEIARDLSTGTCLLCIRNFMSRRGTPLRIRSDNAKNFIGADNELRKQLTEFNSGKIADILANDRI
ncbi:uncharacterized protein LOC118745072 [Rhagoletis pomonella]|uniref:uncharacterized protein LOC118745072 n=1 Tax=Rhagoletis pomonella TaxID=28610 RepID=UPI00177E97AD|nr:uncharacterized protein LOC118745072 [Rhagoletis pomonella]